MLSYYIHPETRIKASSHTVRKIESSAVSHTEPFVKSQPKGIQCLGRCTAVHGRQWNLTHPFGVYSTCGSHLRWLLPNLATAGKHSYHWPKTSSQRLSPPIQVTIHQASTGAPHTTMLRKSAEGLLKQTITKCFDTFVLSSTNSGGHFETWHQLEREMEFGSPVGETEEIRICEVVSHLPCWKKTHMLVKYAGLCGFKLVMCRYNLVLSWFKLVLK